MRGGQPCWEHCVLDKQLVHLIDVRGASFRLSLGVRSDWSNLGPWNCPGSGAIVRLKFVD